MEFRGVNRPVVEFSGWDAGIRTPIRRSTVSPKLQQQNGEESKKGCYLQGDVSHTSMAIHRQFTPGTVSPHRLQTLSSVAVGGRRTTAAFVSPISIRWTTALMISRLMAQSAFFRCDCGARIAVTPTRSSITAPALLLRPTACHPLSCSFRRARLAGFCFHRWLTFDTSAFREQIAGRGRIILK